MPSEYLEDEYMRALVLLAMSAMLFAAGCAKKDDNANMTPPADTTAPMPAEPTPSETPPAPDATTPPAETPPSDPSTTPPPAQ